MKTRYPAAKAAVTSLLAVTGTIRRAGHPEVADNIEHGLFAVTADVLQVLPNQGRGSEDHAQGMAAALLLGAMQADQAFDHFTTLGRVN